jgi:hypothetical protein
MKDQTTPKEEDESDIKENSEIKSDIQLLKEKLSLLESGTP